MTDSNSLPTEIYKETSSLGRLLIKPVDKATAKEMIVKNHYSTNGMTEVSVSTTSESSAPTNPTVASEWPSTAT